MKKYFDELVSWQKEMEEKARIFYDLASEYYSDKPRLSKFLKERAFEEAEHRDIMKEILRTGITDGFKLPEILIGEKFKKNLEEPLDKIFQKLKSKTMTKEEMFDFIIELEMMEYNGLFIYIVKNFIKTEGAIKKAVDLIEKHIEIIIEFLNSIDYCKKRLEEIKKISEIKKESILIVDDEEMIAKFISKILSSHYRAEIALNGLEAYEKLKVKYFDVVLCDIDMPKKNGIDLYNIMKKEFPEKASKFIFHTGNNSKEILDFFYENKLEYIAKPSYISNILDKIENFIENKN